MTQNSLRVHKERQKAGNVPNSGVSSQIRVLLDGLLTKANQKGFYGEVALRFRVQDGIIQTQSVKGEATETFIIQ